MRKIGLGILIMIALILGWGVYQFYLPETQALIKLMAPPEYMKVDGRKPLKEQTRLVEIGGRRFNVPLMYIDGGLDKGLVQDGMNLKYVLPDYRSLWDLKDKQEYLKEFYAGHVSFMLVEPADTRPPIEVSAMNIFYGYAKTKFIGNERGLEKYLAYRLNLDKVELYHDFYLEKSSDGKIIGFLQCSIASRVPNPGCNYRFIDKKIRYNLRVNVKNYFSTWREQKKNAITFIDSFEVKAEQVQSGE